MHSTRGFKKPTIKDKGRAYVRLFHFGIRCIDLEEFMHQQDWKF